MITLNYNGREISCPEFIEELSEEQYKLFLGLAAYKFDNATEMADVWASLLIGVHTPTELLTEKCREEKSAIADHFLASFVIPGEDGAYYLPLETCQNMWPQHEEFSGPKDWLTGLPFGVFVECLSLMEDLNSKETCEEASRAIARRLYSMPEDYDVPDLLCGHAVSLFHSVVKAIMSGPVEIGGRQLDVASVFRSSGGSTRPDDGTGWIGVTFEVASSGVFGNVAQVEATDFWAILLYLYKCKFEQTHQQAQ